MKAKLQENETNALSWKMSAGRNLAIAIRKKLDSHGTAFLDALAEIALDPTTPPNVRTVALIHCLDRQVGKAPEAITIDHKLEVQAMVANITPELQAKMTEVIRALRGAK